MGKTLGINDDYWHGVLAFAGLTLWVQLLFWIYDLEFDNIHVIGVYGLGIMGTLVLQYINEAVQFQDPDRDKKYGSKENFLKNSKKDWKWTFLGLFFAIMLNLIIQAIIYIDRILS